MNENLNYLDFDTGFEADFEPQTRSRSNTWPSNRSEQQIHDYQPRLAPCEEGGSASSSYNNLIPTPANDILVEQDESSDPQDDLSPQSAIKKNSSRRNAWGNHSYADLITQAIEQSPEQRLTLAQIYEWMVQNVDYFKDKGDSNSSAGWKNSIRHNLSLHNRFMRIQNDGAGKSSWWMINHEAKLGKGARRRASSMETKTFEKKKGRLRKREQIRQQMLATSLPGGSHSLLEHTPSPCSSISENIDQYPESPVNQLLTSSLTTNQHVHQNQLHHTQSSNAQNGSPVYHPLTNLQQPTGQPMYSATTNLNNNCLLGQINSPDHQIRTRTASNASSCGRFSPQDENHTTNTALSPLTNVQWTNATSTGSAVATTNGYGQLEMDQCPNDIIDLGSLSIGGTLSEQQQNQLQQTNTTNNQQFNNGATNYLNNNMFIAGNPMFADDRTYMNRSSPAQQINKMNMCKTPQNSINNSMNNLNNLSQINQPQSINDNLLDGPLLNSDCYSSCNLISNGNQSIDSYFNNQTDYSLDEGQLISDLNCDSSNPNDDENNNRIFSLSTLSSNSTLSNSTSQQTSQPQQQPQQSNFNSIRYDQRTNISFNLNNDRVMFNQNPNLMYSNAVGNQLSNGQTMINSFAPLPNDLDPNLYSQNGALDCDIESVIKKELSLDGSLDFNFDTIPHSTATNTSTNNTISNPASCVH